jgi:hypothetical protein
MWLQKNNKLYKEFFSNFETIIGHFEKVEQNSEPIASFRYSL